MSVVIRDLDSLRTFVCPDEAEAVLIIDSNTVLADTVAFEHLECVGWRYSQ